jgi:hypothetical protein
MSSDLLTLGSCIAGRIVQMQTVIEHLGIPEPAAFFETPTTIIKLTWLVLGEDQAARSHRVEQLTAL